MENRHLSVLLWLGGAPPVISGLFAAIAPTWYLSLTGVTEALAPSADQALAFLWHLQGGDAWVAGCARISIALLGTMMLKRVTVLIMIVHSSYELWLLPTHAFPWCSAHTSTCTPLYMVELWAFMALHVALIGGSIMVLLRHHPWKQFGQRDSDMR